MAVDGGPGLGVDPQVEGLEPRREGVAVRLGELGEVRNARRERTSRAVQGTLLKIVHRAVREPLPASFVRGGLASVVRSRAVRSVPARVSP